VSKRKSVEYRVSRGKKEECRSGRSKSGGARNLFLEPLFHYLHRNFVRPKSCYGYSGVFSNDIIVIRGDLLPGNLNPYRAVTVSKLLMLGDRKKKEGREPGDEDDAPF